MVSYNVASDPVGSPSLAMGRVARGVGSSVVRRTNLSLLLRHLHLGGPATRSELCEATGLTRSSVAALVGELEHAGLVAESPTSSEGRPGRPSPRVDLTRDRAVLAIHVAVDSLVVGWVGLGGQPLAVTELDRPRSRIQVDTTLDDVVDLALASWRQAGEPTLMAVGIAVAGLARGDRGDVLVAPNLGWKQVPVVRRLVEDERLNAALGSLEQVPVELHNDGNAACLAEARRGRAKGFDHVLYLLAEVGIAAGLLSEGELLTGSSGHGGEVGHMVVNPKGRLCACGTAGCWETEAGERAVLAAAGLDPNGGRVAVDELVSRADAGDRAALDALAGAGRWLALGVANLCLVTNPQLVVLGGMYHRTFRFIEPELLRGLRERPIPPVRDIRVVPSELTAHAGLLGAAELAFDRVLVDPLHFAGSGASAGC